MRSESKFAFFRQSGWLVVSTVICGVFLMASISLVQPPAPGAAHGRIGLSIPEFGTFLGMLRFFTILGLATTGLQVVMAQDAAGAVTAEAERHLKATVRAVARGIFVLWLVVACVCLLAQESIVRTFKLPEFRTLAVTLGLVLAQLFFPFSQGLLQGQQRFSWLGASIMMNGAGRFIGIFLCASMFARNATTALGGALAGLAAAVLLGVWPSRGLFFHAGGAAFAWVPWLRRALPLSLGTGALLFLMNADVLFVQAHVSREDAAFYSSVAVLGIGLVSFTAPMASVMFPKLVRSVAQAQRSDSLMLALAGTALLGVSAAVFLTIFPALPLRILYFKNPVMLKCAPLVPWFMWSMLPMTLANVMTNNLLARRDFRAVPLLLATAAGYGFELNRYLNAAKQIELFAAFQGVIFRLGVFSALMLAVAIFFSCRRPAARLSEKP